ncbi:MAG: hypothetical protein ACRDTT_20130, partial [Pseudonocardiaceae bacterium]
AADRADRKPQRATKADDDQPQEPAAEKGQESSPDAEDEPLDLHERRAARAALVNMSGGVGVGLAGPSDINAPVAGRDQTVIYHNYAAEQIRAKVVTGTVTHEFLDQLADVYVKPSVYGEAREILKSRHVLVLYGRARSGKWMTALHLLCELKANEICSLPPDEDVRRLGTDDEFGSGFGYYAVDTLAPVQARQLNEFHLNTLSDRFRASRKYLTITVNSGAVRRHELPADFVVSCEQPPDAAQVLSKHLRASLDEARCAKLIAYPPVQAFLQRAFFQPHDVVALVAVLVKASQDGSNLDDALARFDENVVEDVKKWFHDHAELSKYGDRAFMVAMAVFNGAPYQDVLDVAARLEARFLEIEEPENPGRKQLFLAMKRDQLEDACAHSVRIEEVRSVGAMQVEAVEFIDPRYAPIVLDTVWQHPAARGPLLAWLQDLAAHPSVRIRVRAAMAIGRISTYGFGYIQDEILSGWARKPD